jgi:hypothetical protein
MEKRLLNSVVARKIAETTTQPIHEMTDRIALNALIQHYSDVIKKHQRDPDRRTVIFATQDLAACNARLKWLNRLIVNSPPVTPQLNLF